MLQFIKKYWGVIAGGLIVLFVVLALQRCNNLKTNIVKSDTTHEHYTLRDTTFKDTIIYRVKNNLKVIESTKPTKDELDQYSKPDSNYDGLANQYNELKSLYLSENRVTDTIPLADSGYVAINDIISRNEIKVRKTKTFQKEKTISIKDSSLITIKNKMAPNRQVYVGGEITGAKDQFLNGVNIITQYKDRQDRVYQFKAGLLDYNNKVSTQFGVGMLWKL